MKFNKTKIVATLGPASTARPMLKKLMNAGVDVFRVNFSHANYAETSETVKNIRELSLELNIHASVLGIFKAQKFD